MQRYRPSRTTTKTNFFNCITLTVIYLKEKYKNPYTLLFPLKANTSFEKKGGTSHPYNKVFGV